MQAAGARAALRTKAVRGWRRPGQEGSRRGMAGGGQVRRGTGVAGGGPVGAAVTRGCWAPSQFHFYLIHIFVSSRCKMYMT